MSTHCFLFRLYLYLFLFEKKMNALMWQGASLSFSCRTKTDFTSSTTSGMEIHSGATRRQRIERVSPLASLTCFSFAADWRRSVDSERVLGRSTIHAKPVWFTLDRWLATSFWNWEHILLGKVLTDWRYMICHGLLKIQHSKATIKVDCPISPNMQELYFVQFKPSSVSFGGNSLNMSDRTWTAVNS